MLCILTCFKRLRPVMGRLEGCDWLRKLNIKQEMISPDRMINFLVRMDVIL